MASGKQQARSRMVDGAEVLLSPEEAREIEAEWAAAVPLPEPESMEDKIRRIMEEISKEAARAAIR